MMRVPDSLGKTEVETCAAAAIDVDGDGNGDRDDEAFEDFIEYNDVGLPLAYLSSENLCEVSDDGKRYILETWDLFLAALNIKDTGFDSLEEMLHAAGQQ